MLYFFAWNSISWVKSHMLSKREPCESEVVFVTLYVLFFKLFLSEFKRFCCSFEEVQSQINLVGKRCQFESHVRLICIQTSKGFLSSSTNRMLAFSRTVCVHVKHRLKRKKTFLFKYIHPEMYDYKMMKKYG